MSHQEEKFIKYWKKYSAMGKNRFALLSVLFAILSAAIIEFGLLLFPNHDTFSPPSLIKRILIMSIVGFFFGVWYWRSNEKRYQELIK